MKDAKRRSGEAGGHLVRLALRTPMLDLDQERELARRAGAGDQAAAGRLITSHLRMVIRIARNYRGSGLSFGDLVQEGTVGLIQAVQRFNPDLGVRLSTYALWSIRAAIQDHVVRSWSLVRLGTSTAQRSLALALRQVAGDISDDIAARLSRRFDTTAAEVSTLARRLAGDLSLDRPDGSGGSWTDRLESDAPSPEEAAAARGERRLVVRMLAQALSLLPPRERLVIHRRYFAEARQTFEAIGRELGVSKDRVRQLELRALQRLRASLGLSGVSEVLEGLRAGA